MTELSEFPDLLVEQTPMHRQKEAPSQVQNERRTLQPQLLGPNTRGLLTPKYLKNKERIYDRRKIFYMFSSLKVQYE